MKAILCTKYGSPDVLELREVEKPAPKEDEALVKVHAASINAADLEILRGNWSARFGGPLKPKYKILGSDIAGRIEAVGPPPPAPVVFAFFSGTERVLLGSTYYLGHPAVPLDRMAAMVNIEAIGRNLRDSIAVVGAAQSGLTAAVDALKPAPGALGLTLLADRCPSGRMWLLGDHARFHQQGIPVLYLFNGQHGDLHRPGDESRKIALDAVARVGRFLVLLARQLAAPPS